MTASKAVALPLGDSPKHSVFKKDLKTGAYYPFKNVQIKFFTLKLLIFFYRAIFLTLQAKLLVFYYRENVFYSSQLSQWLHLLFLN